MAISKRLRFEIFRRDGHTCRYCGDGPPNVVLTVDHVIPSTLGGSDQPENLVTACRDCNAGKSGSSPDGPVVVDVASEQLRWSRAMRAAAEAGAGARASRDERRERFRRSWTGWTYQRGEERVPLDLPRGWEESVDRFFDAGLVAADLDDAIHTAMRAHGVQDRFRYFAGVCWRTVRERQDMAYSLLESGDER